MVSFNLIHLSSNVPHSEYNFYTSQNFRNKQSNTPAQFKGMKQKSCSHPPKKIAGQAEQVWDSQLQHSGMSSNLTFYRFIFQKSNIAKFIESHEKNKSLIQNTPGIVTYLMFFSCDTLNLGMFDC